MLPGDAAMRSATSACTITVAEESSGISWKKRRTTVAATAYGRLATRAVGGPKGSDSSAGIDGDRVGTHDCEARTLGGGLGEHGKQLRVALDGHDGARLGAERDGERAEAGTDLQHGLVAGERGEFEDAPHDVVVDEEVLAE